MSTQKGRYFSRNLCEWTYGSAVIGYVLAVFFVGVGLLLRHFMDPYLGDTASYVTFFLANAVVIRCTGWGPSILAIGLSTLAVDYFFLTPRYTLWSLPAQYFTSGIFLAANLVILALAHAMRTAKANAEANARTIQEQLTEREAREEKLHLQTTALRAAANAMIITDSQGTIQWVNPAFERLTGYSAAEAVGQNPRLVKSGKQDLAFYKQLWDTILAGQVWLGEIVNKRKDGSFYTEEMTITPVRCSRGEITNFIAVKQDITERKKAEAALAKAQEQLREHADTLEKAVRERTAKLQELVNDLEHFSYTITHDMRAPLRAMQGFAELMLRSDREEYADSSSRDFLERIVTSAARMDALITDALSYTRAVGAGLKIEPVDVAALLKGMLQSYPVFQPPNAEIILEGPFPIVLANAAALTQCFSNLLDNAVKFVAAGTLPRVRIWADQRESITPDQPRMVRLWFEDNGIGIAKEHQQQIFNMFHRVERIYKGTGIGLALVRKNAERMGGKVGVESALGRGSRFWMDLKLMED